MLIALVCGCVAPLGTALAAPDLSAQGDAVVDDAAGFGIEDFHRAQKGSSSALGDGREVGYRYITGKPDGMALIATEEVAVLFVPAQTCDRLGIGLEDQGTVDALTAMLEAIDEANASGGVPLKNLGIAVEATSETELRTRGMVFRFAIACEGRSYAAVEGSSSTPLFCDYGNLVPAEEMNVVTHREPIEELRLFFARIDWSPLFVSMRTTLTSTLVVAVLGGLAGWFTARLRTRLKSVFDVVFTLPMTLPPTVCGFLLLYAFGKNTGFGRWLIGMGVDIPFTWAAAVISAAVVSFPFMYRAARGAFEGVDPDLLDAARTLGWSELRVFARLMVPLAAPSLAVGVLLAFSRALGEFGATMFFAGNYVGETQTIPLAIYYDWMAGDTAVAAFWVIITIAFMLLSTAILNRLARIRLN